MIDYRPVQGVPVRIYINHETRLVAFGEAVDLGPASSLNLIRNIGGGERRERFLILSSGMPQELIDLIAMVATCGENGPWRQLVDWLAQHPEAVPSSFYEMFITELDRGAGNAICELNS